MNGGIGLGFGKPFNVGAAFSTSHAWSGGLGFNKPAKPAHGAASSGVGQSSSSAVSPFGSASSSATASATSVATQGGSSNTQAVGSVYASNGTNYESSTLINYASPNGFKPSQPLDTNWQGPDNGWTPINPTDSSGNTPITSSWEIISCDGNAAAFVTHGSSIPFINARFLPAAVTVKAHRPSYPLACLPLFYIGSLLEAVLIFLKNNKR